MNPLTQTPILRNSRLVVASLFFCILALILHVPMSGQQGARSTGTADREEPSATGAVYKSNAVILVHSDLVLIPVTVTDQSGRAVPGLTKEHFTLFENDAPQEIVHFASEDAPASIGIVFDTSGSMRTKLSKACESVNTLLKTANPDDEFFFVRFSTDAHLTVPLTTQTEVVRHELQTLDASGTTALLDAVRLAIAEMEHAHNSRKAIIIISDGEDNSSRWTVEALKRAVREREIVIYGIGIPSGPYERSECLPGRACGSALLREISRETGGREFEVGKVDQLPAIANTISAWLRHQYILGYVPSHSERDGTYRKIDLKLDPPKGFPRLAAVWRRGYYAPKE